MAKAMLPDVQIIMFTVFEDEDRLFECLMAGANGYILKKNKAPEILLAIKDVFSGGIPMTPEIARKVMGVFKKEKATVQHNLTERELELLKMLSFGHTYKTIAAELAISIETVRSHLKNIYTKMHVASGTEAVAKGLRMRIIK
jgi:DNA-binding NarL/FixJ family response regulator